MEFGNLIIASLTGRNEFPSFTFTFGENDTLAEVPCVLFAHTQVRDLYFDFVLLRDNYVFCIVQNAYLYFVLVRDNYVFSIVVL